MDSFDKIFSQDIVNDLTLDVIFSDKEDGELIDIVATSKLFTESGDDIDDVKEEPEEDDEDVDTVDESYLMEAAKYQFLPRFKQYPELKKYDNVAKDADMLISEHGEPTKNSMIKIARFILRVYDIMMNMEVTIVLPFSILIFPAITILIDKFWSYAAQCGQFALAKAEGKKLIAGLSKVIKTTEDPKVKKKAQDQLELIKKRMKELDAKHEACYFNGNEYTSTTDRDYDYPVHEVEPETTADLDRQLNDDTSDYDEDDDESYNNPAYSSECGKRCETTADLDMELDEGSDCDDCDDKDDDDSDDDKDVKTTADLEKKMDSDDDELEDDDEPVKEFYESSLDDVNTTSELDNVINNTTVDESPEDELEELDGDEDIDHVAGIKESYNGLKLI